MEPPNANAAAAVSSDAKAFAVRRRGELGVYVALVALLAAAYVLGAFVPPFNVEIPEAPFKPLHDSNWFGFLWWKRIGAARLPLVWLPLAALPILVLRLARTHLIDRVAARRWWWLAFRLSISLVALFAFWQLRSRYQNVDAGWLIHNIPRDVPLRGAYFSHDELLEQYVHSRLWFHAHRLWAWDVARTYQVVSCAMGGLFVFAILSFARAHFPRRQAIWFVLLSMSCGFMQLFFGDIEDYTIADTLVALYLFTGFGYLGDTRRSVLLPTVLLATAMCFHLVAGWLSLSLLYLWWIALRRGRRRQLAASIASFAAIGAGVLLFAHFNGLPIQRLHYSHAFGHGGPMRSMFVTPSWSYYRRVVNLAFLLVPGLLFFVPLIGYGRIPWRDPRNRWLAIAALSTALFIVVWDSWIGVYCDWNLFSICGLTFSLLIFSNWVRTEPQRHQPLVFGAYFVLAGSQIYLWILSNHHFAS
jgi:hypothetical protein